MKDRFKYRVWSKQHVRYIQDNEYPIGGDYSLSMTQYGYVEVIGLGDYEEGSDSTHSWGCVKNLLEYIGECIVEQCTGLKDRNGKLIYEGDIVEYYNEKIHQNFREEVLPFRELRTKGIMRHLIDERNADKLEVIGNIHENENLLEI